MNEMVERVKLAMWVAREARIPEESRAAYDTENREIDAMARAAIAAMREPTEVMIVAYGGALKSYIESTPEPERKWRLRQTTTGIKGYKIKPSEKALCRWQAMIDAALSEKTD